MDQHVLARNPELSGALAVELGDSQAALIIEPAAATGGAGGRGPLTTAEQAALIERVWPSVQEANNSADAAAALGHALVDKALVVVTTPDRPLIRDSEGAVQPAPSVEQYTGDLEALRARAEVGPPGDDGAPLVSLSGSGPEGIAQFVQESVSAVMSWPHEDGGRRRPSGTFFERGMDSLVALQLARVLRRGLHRPEIALSTVYCNPTVSQLTSAVLAAIGGGPSGNEGGTAGSA